MWVLWDQGHVHSGTGEGIWDGIRGISGLGGRGPGKGAGRRKHGVRGVRGAADEVAMPEAQGQGQLEARPSMLSRSADKV